MATDKSIKSKAHLGPSIVNNPIYIKWHRVEMLIPTYWVTQVTWVSENTYNNYSLGFCVYVKPIQSTRILGHGKLLEDYAKMQHKCLLILELGTKMLNQYIHMFKPDHY